jgi:hypothetical protein
MAEKEYTFEDIDKLVQQADLAGLEKHAAQLKGVAGGATAVDVLGQICPIYKSVRPILVALSQTPFIPKNWKKVIKAFIQAMDKICP